MLNKRKLRRKLIIFDLDGTVFEDFLEKDKKIIMEIFGDNILLKIIDGIARYVNSFDIIGNTMFILKLRLFLYSIISLKNYRKSMRKYACWYVKEAKETIFKQYNNKLSHLRLSGYDIVILSNNLFSSLIKDTPVRIITTNDKKRKLKVLKENYEGDIQYLVGNNYYDDIKSANKAGISAIYIGNSRFLINSSKVYFSSFSLEEVINNLLK